MLLQHSCQLAPCPGSVSHMHPLGTEQSANHAKKQGSEEFILQVPAAWMLGVQTSEFSSRREQQCPRRCSHFLISLWNSPFSKPDKLNSPGDFVNYQILFQSEIFLSKSATIGFHCLCGTTVCRILIQYSMVISKCNTFNRT